MNKITYADKTFLNENVGVADINKVKDTDMNEIKRVVNDNDDILEAVVNGEVYSFGEVLTNKVDIDENGVEHPIYRTKLATGVVNSTGNTTFTHGISNIDYYFDWKVKGIANTKYNNFPVPFVANQGMYAGAYFSFRTLDADSFQIYASATGYSFIVILEYAKEV